MSASKSNYPERPTNRAKSSQSGGGRRKFWSSLRETVNNRGHDTGARSNLPWWKSPMMKAERLARAATRA